jgi:hypothetical protein
MCHSGDIKEDRRVNITHIRDYVHLFRSQQAMRSLEENNKMGSFDGTLFGYLWTSLVHKKPKQVKGTEDFGFFLLSLNKIMI